ncbi:MarR family transcriptional regulator [Rhizobium sp. KVB221]|uniref:MarR family transcriptional regulator n=1 Tax=Rhizobium setariae TaxID=2801340 RepID=A0A936YMY8_9HYPH|nr:MarR family transcriptional regulator [Rhizobium setariae]MBL0371687.1 MarR family transcriptional regulator [Rhizobium setariae]
MVKKDKPSKKVKTEKPKERFAHGVLQSEMTRAARSMRTFLTHSLSASGIYAGQDGVILALAQAESLTAGAIAGQLGVKPPTMTRTLARMEAQGFVARLPGDIDGRQMRATLTEAGRQHVGAIAYAVKATEAFALAGLTEKEIRQFGKVLRKINQNFQADGEEAEVIGE